MKNIIPQLNKQFQTRVNQEWIYATRSPIPVCGMARVCLIHLARGLNLASLPWCPHHLVVVGALEDNFSGRIYNLSSDLNAIAEDIHGLGRVNGQIENNYEDAQDFDGFQGYDKPSDFL